MYSDEFVIAIPIIEEHILFVVTIAKETFQAGLGFGFPIRSRLPELLSYAG
ncbi:hypothetical protein D3C74_411290 [compost metagenome]